MACLIMPTTLIERNRVARFAASNPTYPYLTRRLSTKMDMDMGSLTWKQRVAEAVAPFNMH